MILKNLFTGQQWRNRYIRLMDMGRGEERAPVKQGLGNGTPLQHSCLENPMDRGT